MSNNTHERSSGFRVATNIFATLALAFASIGCADNNRSVDPAPLISTPSLVGTIPTGILGNGGYTGTDGQCHIGPPNVNAGQNGCQDGQPILDGSINVTPTGIPGNGGYTGTDGQCHIGPPNVNAGQNGCQDGQPIPSGN